VPFSVAKIEIDAQNFRGSPRNAMLELGDEERATDRRAMFRSASALHAARCGARRTGRSDEGEEQSSQRRP
jgi:hypothetical protein